MMLNEIFNNMEKHRIYFDEVKHRYYDDFNNPFTSVTTVISKYTPPFPDDMAYNCYLSGKKGNPKYAGKSAAQIKEEWRLKTEKSLAQGNKDHNFFEDAIKDAGSYYRTSFGFKGNQIYTIEDVIQNEQLGVMDLNSEKMLVVKRDFPYVYQLLEVFVSNGYRVLSEVGIFNLRWLISGLIDLPLIKGNKVYILDWKTNNDDIMFEGGHWDHDRDGKTTGYRRTLKKMLSPINTLDDCTGSHYAMQLSTYGRLCEEFGLEVAGILLLHIRKFPYKFGHPHHDYGFDIDGKRQVDIHKIPYLKSEVERMAEDHIGNQVLSRSKVLRFDL